MLLEALDRTVDAFIGACDGVGPAVQVNREWTVKEVASHITYWHESFARNLSDVVAGSWPRPLQGTYAELSSWQSTERINAQSAAALRVSWSRGYAQHARHSGTRTLQRP